MYFIDNEMYLEGTENVFIWNEMKILIWNEMKILIWNEMKMSRQQRQR